MYAQSYTYSYLIKHNYSGIISCIFNNFIKILNHKIHISQQLANNSLKTVHYTKAVSSLSTY